MTESILFGSQTIHFYVEFTGRKSLGISVTPEMEVFVRAPLETSIEKIKEKVIKKAPWIIKQKNFFLTFQPRMPERKFVGGETHLYMGRQYRLHVSIGPQESVKLKGKFIEVITTDKAHVKKLMQEWYLQHAQKKLQEIADPLIERFKKYKVQPSSIQLRAMPTRWGSCTAKGKIILNPELIKAPRGCIEYVIIHELCHLLHRDHSENFLHLQRREMEDWEKWKMRLEKLLA